MKQKLFFRIDILLAFLLLLSNTAGCGTTSNIPSVSEGNVFHTLDEIDATFMGSRNVTVEQLPNGMRKATGSERAALIEAGLDRASLELNPEETGGQASVLGYMINPRIGNVYLIVTVHLGSDSSILALAPDFPRFDPVTTFGFLPGPNIPLKINSAVSLLPGAPNSENISVKINPAIGYTEVAGLRFREEVRLNVWENGIVELDKENVSVSDIYGQKWISKRVRVGEQSVILLIKE
jgi:hypothetical protein